MDRIAVMEALSERLSSGMSPISSLRDVARVSGEKGLIEAVSKAIADRSTSAEAIKATSSFFGEEFGWVIPLMTDVDPCSAGRILREASSVARTFRQLMEEREGMLRLKRRLSRVLILVLGALTSVLSEVSSLLLSLVGKDAGFGPISLMGFIFSFLILEEVGEGRKWAFLYLVAYAGGKAFVCSII